MTMPSVGAWLAATGQVYGPRVLADPTPAPSGGFDWNRVRPDPGAVPKSDLFYMIVDGLMFLGVVAAAAGLAAGAIAFGVGPIFGAHIISDRGKSMMWKAGLVAVIIGSLVSIVSWVMAK